MFANPAAPPGVALLGDIGRKRLRFALTDAAGRLDRATARDYDAATTTTVSGALSRFQRDTGLAMLPARSALAVAGLARGETVTITRTRLLVSRSGLSAMLGQPPVILNDCAASAWALADGTTRVLEAFAGTLDLAALKPGCYCLVVPTTGLGVAVLTRSETGQVTVLPTEAGHGALVTGSRALADMAARIFPGQHPVCAEQLVSAPGLLALHTALVRERGGRPALKPEDVTARIAGDPLAREACTTFVQALWAQAGSLALTYGAWDGVILAGRLAEALRPLLRQPGLEGAFIVPGKFTRALAAIPRVLVQQENAELRGAAEALRHAAPGTPPLAAAA